MFSDHLRKIDNASGKTLLLIAAGLVIVCQLVAMVLVAQGQVDKAYVREASQASERSAVAWCIETSYGAELKSCTNRLPAYSEPDNTQFVSAKPHDYVALTPASRY
jgi:hypothetical protein